MIGDGELEYDIGNDGEKYSLGACSVSTAHISFAKWPTQTRRAKQANFRRTNVATKLKMTYLRDQYLNVKMQYKACESQSSFSAAVNISPVFLHAQRGRVDRMLHRLRHRTAHRALRRLLCPHR